MSQTTVTVVAGGYTEVAGEDGETTTIEHTAGSSTVIEHGTINQPYNGPTIYVQSTAPVSPVTGSIWYDTSI